MEGLRFESAEYTKLQERIKELETALSKEQESEFHPDWSMLQATRESLREHMAIERVLYARIKELETSLGELVRIGDRKTVEWDRAKELLAVQKAEDAEARDSGWSHEAKAENLGRVEAFRRLREQSEVMYLTEEEKKILHDRIRSMTTGPMSMAGQKAELAYDAVMKKPDPATLRANIALWEGQIAEADERAKKAEAEVEKLKTGIKDALQLHRTPEDRLTEAVESGDAPSVHFTREHFRLVDALHELIGTEVKEPTDKS